jgi:hypothetical protein
MRDPLGTYLQDHLGGAKAAIDPVEAMRERQKDTLLSDFASDLLTAATAHGGRRGRLPQRDCRRIDLGPRHGCGVRAGPGRGVAWQRFVSNHRAYVEHHAHLALGTVRRDLWRRSLPYRRDGIRGERSDPIGACNCDAEAFRGQQSGLGSGRPFS